jgi:tetratricopeptide (TPR) repeat protein
VGLIALMGVAIPLSTGIARAELPTRLEPVYAEAVIAYNSKDYPKAIAALDELLRQKPGVAEALELKALSLKATKDDAKSAAVYEELVKAKLADGKTEKDVAPYRYELGLIRFRENRPAEARPQLEGALKAGFNEPACHFFLGLSDFRENKLNDAEGHLKETSSSGVAELRPAADFYLGQIYSKLSRSSGATQSFFSARNGARDLLGDAKADPEARKVATQIRDATEKALKPFDRSGWFGNAGVTLGYDTNVLSVPADQSPNPTDSNSPGSSKATLLGGVGYMSSPLDSWQIVPSYRVIANLNLNTATKAGEFVMNDLSVYLTRNALARFSWGVKGEMVYTFQNSRRSGDPERRFGYEGYSVNMPFGPYLRYEIAPQYALSVDLNLVPQNFLIDDDNSESPYKRSGIDKNARVSLRHERGDRYWNPTVSALLDSNSTDGRGNVNSGGRSGAEFTSRTAGMELSDVMRPIEALTVTLTGSVSFPRYIERVDGPRQDRTYFAAAGGTYRVTPRYTALADLQYTYNSSTVPSLYQYTRLVVSVGASYSF